MPEIALVRQPNVELTEHDKECARRAMFGMVDGLGDRGKKQWRRFWNGLLQMEPGEIAMVRTQRRRSGPFHRRHMLIENSVFEAQERVADFEQFRLWLKVGSGLVVWMAGPKGGVFPVPKSISYEQMEEDEMREFHEAAMAFLRTDHATRYLWPHIPAKQCAQAIDAVLSEFNE